MINLLAGLFLAVTATGQATEAQKVDAIWIAVQDRFTAQEDAWFDDGDFPVIIQLLRMHVEVDPHDYDVATNLGWMQENVEEWDDALATYEQYHRSNPKDPDGALPIAEYYFRKKQYEKVIPLLQNAISDKAHPNMFRLLAHSYEKVKRWEDAKKVWDRYIALAPKDLTAVANRKRVIEAIAKARG